MQRNSYGALRIWKQPAGGTFCIDTDPMHLEENSTGKPIGEKCLKGKDLIKYGIHVSNNLFEGCNPNNWIKLLGSRFITYESWLDIKNQSLSPKEMAANFLKRENSIGL